MKQIEYKEGPEARENVERGMKSLFQVTKTVVVKAEKKPAKSAKRISERDVSRDSGGEA